MCSQYYRHVHSLVVELRWCLGSPSCAHVGTCCTHVSDLIMGLAVLWKHVASSPCIWTECQPPLLATISPYTTAFQTNFDSTASQPEHNTLTISIVLYWNILKHNHLPTLSRSSNDAGSFQPQISTIARAAQAASWLRLQMPYSIAPIEYGFHAQQGQDWRHRGDFR